MEDSERLQALVKWVDSKPDAVLAYDEKTEIPSEYLPLRIEKKTLKGDVSVEIPHGSFVWRLPGSSNFYVNTICDDPKQLTFERSGHCSKITILSQVGFSSSTKGVKLSVK